MPEFVEYSLKISPIWGPKLIENGVLAGSWAVQVPSGETMLARDRFLMDLGLDFGSLSEPRWDQIKLIWSDSTRPTRLHTLLDGFQHRFLIDFGAMFELFKLIFLMLVGGRQSVHVNIVYQIVFND